MAGYTRQSTMADGDTITAALFNNEYNQLVNAFSNTSGHKHDGTAAEGPVIGLIGDAGETSPNNKVVIDTTNNYIEFYVEVSSSPVQQLYIADGAIIPVTDNDIDLGTSSLEFKDLYLDGTATIDTLTVDEAATIGTTLGVTGATTLSSTLGVTGATTLSSTLGVTGATTLSSTLAVTGTSTLTGNVTASNDLSVGGNLTVTGNATISGNLTFGDADTDSITLTADVASNIVPDVDDTYDLGTATKQWRNLYIDGTAEVDTLSIDGTAVTSTAAELNILDGVTATAAEINTLDGITATVAELNILDGVTSTATELNIVDGDTLATATTLADADRVVVNDAGVMKQVALTDFETYFEGALDTLSNVTTVGALNAGSITSGFGAIDNGSSNITTTGTVTYGSLSDGVITITAFADEDDMVSNSATLVPTQQSVKAYVDAQVATANELSELTDVNLTTPADASLLFYDTLTSKWIDNVVSGDITIADTGVAAISSGVIVNDDINASAAISVSKTALTAGTGLTLSTDTLAIDSTVATLTGTQTLTNKTLTSPVLNTGVSGTAFLDDDTFATATASTLASSESIKAYVDSSVSGISSNSISDADGDTKIQVEESADEDIIRFDTFGTERMVINASGNVGIGTASPSEILEINTSSRFAGRLVSTDATADAGPYLTLFRDSASPAASDDIGGLLVKGNNASGTETSMGIFKMEITDTTAASEDADWVFINRNAGTLPERFRIQANGNVGIGTASPDQLLHISAAADPAIRIENTDTTATSGQTIGKIEFEGQDSSTNAAGVRALIDAQYAGVGGQGRLKFQLAQENSASLSDSLLLNYGTQQFFTSGSEAMRIDSSGNVGIGTSSPAHLLHLSAADPRIQLTDTNTNVDHIINANSSVGNLTIDVDANAEGSSPNLIIDVAGAERMRIASSGNVGIGTSNPNYKLEINHTGADTTALVLNDENTVSNATGLYLRSTSEGRISVGSGAALTFAGDGGSSEHMRIDSSGNVGIGTTSPQGTLHVKNTSDSATLTSVSDSIVLSHQSGSYTDGNYYGVLGFSKANSNGATLGAAIAPVMDGTGAGTDLTFSTALAAGSCFEKMRITDSGNVGIGTSSPSHALDVVGLVRASDQFQTYAGSRTLAINANFGGSLAALGTSSNDHLMIFTNNTERMRIDNSGNVGIGTTSPSAKLEINDTSSADSTGLIIANGYTTDAANDASEIMFRLYRSYTPSLNDAAFVKAVKEQAWDSSGDRDASLTFGTRSGGTEPTERLRIDSSGNVGIGTTSPSRKLQVYNTSAAAVLAITTSTSNLAQLALGDTDDDNYAQIILNNATNKLQIQNGGGGTVGERGITLDSSENVGIGTSSPSAKLHISDTNSPEIRLQDSDAGSTYNITAIQNAAGSLNLNTRDSSGSFVSTDYQISKNGNGATAHKWFIAGSEKVRIDSSGRLLIGKTVVDNATVGFRFDGASGFASFARDGGEPLYLNRKTSDGDVIKIAKNDSVVGVIGTQNWGIGTSSPTVPLEVSGHVKVGDADGSTAAGDSQLNVKAISGEDAIVRVMAPSGNDSELRLGVLGTTGVNSLKFGDVLDNDVGYIQYDHGSNYLRFGTNANERARFDSSGNFLVGKTTSASSTAGLTLEPAGALVATRSGGEGLICNRLTSTGALVKFRYANSEVGSISTDGSATAYNTSSDARLKDITGSARGLEVINKLNPVAYDWKADGKSDEGLIAQEVQELVPNAVSQNEDGYYQMDYSKLVTPLIKAIQEQQEQIESLKSEIKLLKGGN